MEFNSVLHTIYTIPQHESKHEPSNFTKEIETILVTNGFLSKRVYLQLLALGQVFRKYYSVHVQ